MFTFTANERKKQQLDNELCVLPQKRRRNLDGFILFYFIFFWVCETPPGETTTMRMFNRHEITHIKVKNFSISKCTAKEDSEGLQRTPKDSGSGRDLKGISEVYNFSTGG